MAGDGKRPFFGSMPDFGNGAAGYAIGGVLKDGPAEKAGLKTGDLVVEFGDAKITGLEDFTAALMRHKAGDRVRTVVRRGDQSLTVEVTLDPPR
jgi:S1-C subfamily serine protease